MTYNFDTPRSSSSAAPTPPPKTWPRSNTYQDQSFLHSKPYLRKKSQQARWSPATHIPPHKGRRYCRHKMVPTGSSSLNNPAADQEIDYARWMSRMWSRYEQVVSISPSAIVSWLMKKDYCIYWFEMDPSPDISLFLQLLVYPYSCTNRSPLYARHHSFSRTSTTLRYHETKSYRFTVVSIPRRRACRTIGGRGCEQGDTKDPCFVRMPSKRAKISRMSFHHILD